MTALAALSLESPAAEPLAQPVRFTVPILDSEEFAGLKLKRRQEVTLTLQILERVHGLRNDRNFVAATNTLALSYRHIRGLSGPRLRAKYYAYIKSGCDWRTLVKGYKGQNQQPAEFIEFLKGLIEQNHRSVEQALNVLREELWPNGAEIPGYGTWQSWFAATFPHSPVPISFPRVYPKGWSVPNLRRYGPSRAEKRLFQRGLAAAHGNLPTIRRDPSRLRPMEWIVIDDFELDVMCTFRGDPERGLKPQIAYVAGLLAMCVGTRKKLGRLLGPRVEREAKQPDGTTKTVTCNIRAVDVQVLLYEIFRTHGLPDYEVTIICENATASISPDLELMLSTIYGGRIRVHRTSLIEHKTLANGFVERGGTPWEKGWLESDLNKLWNMLANLPGYKGSNQRLNAPADLAEKLKYASKFLGQGDGKPNLPPEIIDELRLPFLSLEQLEAAFDFVIECSERRTKHRCLGFDTVTEFVWGHPQLPAPEGIDPHGPNSFRSLALLTEAQQKLMVPVERKESPLERWQRLSAAHARRPLPANVLALFLLTPKKATWRNHAVTFTHQKVGYSYVDDDGVMSGIAEGTEVLAYVDLKEPAAALVAKVDGTPLGVLRMLGDSPAGVDITNPDAVAAARARRAAIVNRVLATVRGRPLHQAADAKLAEDRAHNEQIVETWQRESAAPVEPDTEPLPPAPAETPALPGKLGEAVARIRKSNRRARSTADVIRHATGLDSSSLL